MKLSKKRLFEILKSEEGKKLIDRDTLGVVEKQMSQNELLESIDKDMTKEEGIKANNTLTQDRLKEVLTYNPHTGEFIWNEGFEETDSQYYNKDLLLVIKIDKVEYKAHHLAFLFMEGWLPDAVFHIDHDPAQLRFNNLVPDRSGRGVKPLEIWNPANPVRQWEWHEEKGEKVAQVIVPQCEYSTSRPLKLASERPTLQIASVHRRPLVSDA